MMEIEYTANGAEQLRSSTAIEEHSNFNLPAWVVGQRSDQSADMLNKHIVLRLGSFWNFIRITHLW